MVAVRDWPPRLPPVDPVHYPAVPNGSRKLTVRRDVGTGIGLVAVVLTAAVMTADEVVALLGLGCSGGSTLSTSEMDFIEDADWLGNRRWINVEFEDHRVVAWRTISMPRTRPPWLDRALRAAGGE
jgi:hypothetical protein